MTEEEIKGLLPFYVAGTLTPDQKKAIEDAIVSSPDLKEELRFWQRARVASRLDAEDAKHLSPAQIVDYSQHLTTDHTERLRVEQHLISCADCRHEYEAIGGMLASPERPHIHKLGWLQDTLKRFKVIRPSYAFAMLAIAVAVIVTLRPKPESESPENITQSGATDSTIERPPSDTIRANVSLVLMYRPALRGTDKAELPSVILNKGSDSDLLIAIQVPASGIPLITYSVIINDSSGDLLLTAKNIAPVPQAPALGILELVVKTNAFTQSGLYSIIATEMIPDGKHGFTPESHSYDFRVTIR